MVGTNDRILFHIYRNIKAWLFEYSRSLLPETCENGEVRLADGYSEFSGRVEVCIDHQWGTVQDEQWSLLDAYVVCQQLGLTGDVA